MWYLFLVALLFIQLNGLYAGSFDDPYLGNATMYYSEVAYCGDYMGRTYSQEATGFKPVYEFDGKDETKGFLGYNDADRNIFLVYRGSQDIANWATNLKAMLISCPDSWNLDSCKVHKGFLLAMQDVMDGILSQLTTLMSKYPTYKVIVTGHSLGAALATVTATELVTARGVDKNTIKLWHYGSPRVFNDAGSEAVSNLGIPIHRVTHYKDMVVHTPTQNMHYQHTSGEWYEDPTAEVRACSGYEDPTCSYQWRVTSISDHLHYMGKEIGSDGCYWL